MRYSITLTLALVLCFVAQSITLHLSGGRTAKSESNFFSSLARIQQGARGTADVMMLGSSMTGRLPDRAHGYDGWANMGCDGGGPVDTLRAMDEGILPAAPLLVLEANSLHLALNEQPTEIGKSMRGIWFRAGLRLPAIAAYARPSAMAYSRLIGRRIGNFGSPDEDEDLGVTSRPEKIAEPPVVPPSPAEERLIEEVRGILARLQTKGSRAVIVWLPPARPDGRAPAPWMMELARRCDVPYWDLGQEAAPETVTLTDRVHMDAASAARTIRSLRKAIGNETR
jgi:hypothetical protein